MSLALTATEGAASTIKYGIVLESQPFGDVFVNLEQMLPADHLWLFDESPSITVHPTHYRFTPETWNIRQPVDVTIINDNIARSISSYTLGVAFNVTAPGD